MAIALVQSVNIPRSTADDPVTSVSSTQTGNLIVVLIGCNGPHSASSVTDNQGNTYLHQAGFIGSDGNRTSDVWYAENATGGVTSVTVLISTGGSFRGGFIREYSGVKSSGSLDVFGTSSGFADSTTDAFGPSLVPTFNDELFLTFITFNDTTDPYASVASPWSLTTNVNFAVASFIQVTAATAQADFDISAGHGGNYVTTGITFQSASPAQRNSSLFLVFD